MYKLQRLQQKDMTTEECRKKMELLLMRTIIREKPIITMARFQSSVNHTVRDKVQLLSYNDLV